jgi:hypothetical protein
VTAKPATFALTLLVLLGGAASCAQLVGADFDEGKVRRCSSYAPFEAPTRLTLNEAVAEAWGPRLSGDELSLYFTSSGDEFVATRASRNDEFSAPRELTSLNSAADEMAPSVTADELDLFLETTRAGPDVKIFAAHRHSVGEEFGALVPLEQVNSSIPGVIDVQPFVVPSGEALYFASTRNPGADFELFRAECVAGVCGEVTAVAGVNSAAAELWPVVSADELTLYFASSRSQPSTLGSYDVFVAHRRQRSEAFGAAENLQQVNSSEGDYPGSISQDGCFLYLTRYNGQRRSIFVAKRGQ